MICIPVLDVWQRCAGPTAVFLFEELIRKPISSLWKIAEGLALALPELVAAARYVLDHLASDNRDRLQQGLQRIEQGWREARWLLLVPAVVALFMALVAVT